MHWLQIIILINFVILILSLFSSLFVVYSERGEGKKSFYLLSLRVFLALSLLALIGFGIAKGLLGSKAPWDRFPAAEVVLQSR